MSCSLKNLLPVAMTRFLAQRFRLCVAAMLLVFLASLLLAVGDVSAKPFRLIYVQGGSYTDYQRVFRGFTLGLEEYSLVQQGNTPIPKDTDSVQPMWEWIGAHANSKDLVFLADGYYSAEYDEQKMTAITQEIADRIKQRNDVDAILSFGTLAGKYLSKLDTNVPILFVSVTDAVGAKIVPSVSDSGKDNHVAIIMPGIDERNITIFHSIFPFTRMGIAYQDTPNGRDSVALTEIEATAQKLGIQLVRCIDTFEIPDLDLASDRLAACHRKLIHDGAEAIFLTTNISLTPSNAPKILKPIMDAKLPNFSQLGSSDVKLGVLMSIAEANTIEEGIYAANLLEQIMQGKKPRSLSQFFESYATIAINLRMAAHIGWNPSLKTLLMVDEFYN